MKPLDGLLVLDLTRLLPGPFCASLLRSWGARTVKVEDLEAGDYLREVHPVWFAHLNAGALSVGLDLKHPRGREVFLRLAATADVVLEGFRPGVMERLGLAYETLKAINPRLVLVSLSGYPRESELAGRAGHDLTYLARSGLLSLMGEPPPVQLADLTAGWAGAAGALAAVLAARAKGQGVHVDASLFGAACSLGALLTAEVRAGAAPTRESLPLAGALPCYSVYETSDGGRVALGALEPKFWRAFCSLVGRSEWGERGSDPALRPEVAALFRLRSSAEWAVLSAGSDCCLGPVVSLSANGLPEAPLMFGGTTWNCDSPAPSRGAHTLELLKQIGYSEQEIGALAAEGLIPGDAKREQGGTVRLT